MVPIDRREFIAASGLVAIAGCLARGNEDDTSGDGDEALPESLATVIDPVPTEVDDLELRQLYVVSPDPDGSSNQALPGFGSAELGLEAEQVDRALTAMYGEFEGTITAVTGEFAADEVEEPERAAASIEDGLVVTASSRADTWDAGLEAAEAAADDPDVGVDGDVATETLFHPVSDAELIIGLVSVTDEAIPDEASIDTDAVDAIALGRTSDLDAREETVTYVAVFAEGESPDESVIEEILRTDGNEDITPDDVDIETGDRRATTTFTQDLPQSRLPDNSPDVYVGIVSRQDTDTVELHVSGDESVDASNLEYRVDGEPADPPWDEDATLEPEDRFEVDVEPMTLVSVLWVDPELDDVKQPFGRTVVGGHRAFEAQFDHDANDLEIEYTAERSIDADRFDVVRRSEDSNTGDTTSLSEFVDSLDPGTEFVVSDVEYGDSVQIEMDVESESEFSSETVFWYSANPPGQFRLEQDEDGDRELVFGGQREVVAEDFRVLVDGEPADAQWTDVAETLSGDERLDVDVELGQELTVEYLGDDEPAEVFSREVHPSASFDFDVDDTSIEITHDGGDAMNADSLAVELYPSDDEGLREDAFGEYDTVETGDAITVEYQGDEELEAVVVLYDGKMVDYTEIGVEESGSGGGDDAESDE